MFFMLETLGDAKVRPAENYLPKLPIEQGGSGLISLVAVDQIIALRAQGHYAEALMAEATAFCPRSLAMLEKRLDPRCFCASIAPISLISAICARPSMSTAHGGSSSTTRIARARIKHRLEQIELGSGAITDKLLLHYMVELFEDHDDEVALRDLKKLEEECF